MEKSWVKQKPEIDDSNLLRQQALEKLLSLATSPTICAEQLSTKFSELSNLQQPKVRKKLRTQLQGYPGIKSY